VEAFGGARCLSAKMDAKRRFTSIGATIAGGVEEAEHAAMKLYSRILVRSSMGRRSI